MNTRNIAYSGSGNITRSPASNIDTLRHPRNPSPRTLVDPQIRSLWYASRGGIEVANTTATLATTTALHYPKSINTITLAAVNPSNCRSGDDDDEGERQRGDGGERDGREKNVETRRERRKRSEASMEGDRLLKSARSLFTATLKMPTPPRTSATFPSAKEREAIRRPTAGARLELECGGKRGSERDGGARCVVS